MSYVMYLFLILDLTLAGGLLYIGNQTHSVFMAYAIIVVSALAVAVICVEITRTFTKRNCIFSPVVDLMIGVDMVVVALLLPNDADYAIVVGPLMMIGLALCFSVVLNFIYDKLKPVLEADEV